LRGPCHGDLYDVTAQPESWWRASAPALPRRQPLAGETRAEVAIIGCGFAGLSCALTLAQRGVDAVALDAGAVGWGASGRNGGIVGLSSDKLDMAARIARVGEAEARRLTETMVEGARRLRAFCAAQGVETQGDAEVIVAPDRRAFAALRAEAEAARWGVTAQLLSREAYAERGFIGPQQHGALRIRPGFALHPLMLTAALARAAEAAGARLHPFSEALRWRREGADHLLETARGVLRAKKVVLATNGFTPDALHPAFAARAMPVLSMIGVTRPLSDEALSRHAWAEDSPLTNTRRMLYYWRMLPQRRLLFGMRGDLSGSRASAPRWRARLAAHLARAYPAWRDIPLDFYWRGPICATRAMAPAVGRLADDASVFHAFGWHGSGVNGAQVAGRLLAGVIAGAPDATIPALWRGLPPRIPLPGLRPLWLGATLAAYRAADAWDAR